MALGAMEVGFKPREQASIPPGYERDPHMLFVTAALQDVVVCAGGALLLSHRSDHDLSPLLYVRSLQVDNRGRAYGLEHRVLDALRAEGRLRGYAGIAYSAEAEAVARRAERLWEPVLSSVLRAFASRAYRH
jgi:hypothetical protein